MARASAYPAARRPVVAPTARSRKSCPDPVLSIDDLRFVNEYEARGFAEPGHIDAYLVVHPECKRASAKVGASRVLSRVAVQQEIRYRIEATRVVSVDSLGASLLKYRQWAEDAHDYQAAEAICMSQAKLAGLLVEKREVKDVSEQHAPVISDLVRQAMRPITPSLSPSAPTTNEPSVGQS